MYLHLYPLCTRKRPLCLQEHGRIDHDRAPAVVKADRALVLLPRRIFVGREDRLGFLDVCVSSRQRTMLRRRECTADRVELRGMDGLLSIEAQLGALVALVLEVRLVLVLHAHHILCELRPRTIASIPIALAMVTILARGYSNPLRERVRRTPVDAQ